MFLWLYEIPYNEGFPRWWCGNVFNTENKCLICCYKDERVSIESTIEIAQKMER